VTSGGDGTDQSSKNVVLALVAVHHDLSYETVNTRAPS